MMQAQPTGMIQINYKKEHFDEINKKLKNDIIRSSLWSSQLQETSRNIAAKTKMTCSLLEVY